MAKDFLLKIKNCNAQNIRSSEMENSLFGTYKNSIMPHVKHVFQTASDMVMATMCAYT